MFFKFRMLLAKLLKTQNKIELLRKFKFLENNPEILNFTFEKLLRNLD